MAQGKITPLSQMTGNMSKLERQVRAEIESEVKTITKPKPVAFISKAEKKLFYNLTNLNDQFTESDSLSLSLLTKSLSRYTLLNARLDELDELDEQCIMLEKRIHAYNKQVVVHMQALGIPLTQRLRMNNEIAKLLIEEKKLEQMELQNQPQPINPALALLQEIEALND